MLGGEEKQSWLGPSRGEWGAVGHAVRLIHSATAPPFAPRSHLSNELAPLVHTDVFLTLSTLDAHTASKRVRLHYEFGYDGGGGERPLSIGDAGSGPPPNQPDLRTWVGGTGRPSSKKPLPALPLGPALAQDLGMDQVRLAGGVSGLW